LYILKNNEFPNDVYALGSQIVSGTMEVSQSVVCYCIDMEIGHYYFTRIGCTQLATANGEVNG
jgi:hypothetical protein